MCHSVNYKCILLYFYIPILTNSKIIKAGVISNVEILYFHSALVGTTGLLAELTRRNATEQSAKYDIIIPTLPTG